jgi:hypothetical protein
MDYEDQGTGLPFDYAFLLSGEMSETESSDETVKMNVWMLNDPEHQNLE